MAMFLFGWWLVGLAGFIYWWTSEHDLKLVDLMMGLIFAVIGPLAWVLGYLIHGKKSGTKTITIMKSRERK